MLGSGAGDQLKRLIALRTSPRYLDRLAAGLQQKAGQEAKFLRCALLLSRLDGAARIILWMIVVCSLFPSMAWAGSVAPMECAACLAECAAAAFEWAAAPRCQPATRVCT